MIWDQESEAYKQKVKDEWEEIVKRLRDSKYDLNKIVITFPVQ